MRVRNLFRSLLVLLLLGVTVVGIAPAADAGQRNRAPRVAGMVIVESNQSFEDSWAALVAALEVNPNIGVVTTIDHAAAAASVGLELDPNRVIVFGNPNLGTPLMQVNQLTGIDLPQKIQVFEEHGRVWIGFNDATYLRARHRLGDQPGLDTIAGALRTFAGIAADDEIDGRSFGERRFRRNPGLTTLRSDADIDTTWNRLLAAIDASPANIAFQIDHQANAASVGLELRPTRVVVFGNPNLGTPLMVDEPTAGIDLPLKILVWEDEHGRTWVTTNNERLARRHGIGRSELGPIETAIENFLAVATTSP